MPVLRLDREISVRVMHPWMRVFARSEGNTVPILMYHGIRNGLAYGRHPYFETNTRPDLFAEQMQLLAENGYATVDLTEALAAIMTGKNGQERVAITFDDGYRDFYDHALPVLAKYRMKATVFVVSDWTRQERTSRNGVDYLNWREVREMNEYGIRIGSHTASHPELYSMRSGELEYEIRQSKESIEDETGEPVRSFSYPYAFPEHDRNFVERLRDLLQTHGYQNGVSTVLGTASRKDDWFFLPRLPINSHDDPRLFKAKLEHGYDWLHPAQKLFKRVKAQFLRVSADQDVAYRAQSS